MNEAAFDTCDCSRQLCFHRDITLSNVPHCNHPLHPHALNSACLNEP